MPKEQKEFLCKKCGAVFSGIKLICTCCKSTEVVEIKEHGVAKDEEVKIEE